MIKIGHGYDVHAFGGDKVLVLGGEQIGEHIGLVAHSDGDVILHAVCDSLLGAAGLNDIGFHFPDTSDEFNNVCSRSLLTKVFELIAKEHYQVGNLDITVIAQTPKMSKYISKIRSNIADDLQMNTQHINVKATTTEHLGYIGRKEGIAVHCVCLLNSVTSA